MAGVIQVLPGFARDVVRGRPRAFRFCSMGPIPNTASIVSGYATQIIARYSDQVSQRLRRERLGFAASGSFRPAGLSGERAAAAVGRAQPGLVQSGSAQPQRLYPRRNREYHHARDTLANSHGDRSRKRNRHDGAVISHANSSHRTYRGQDAAFVFVGFWDMLLVLGASLVIFHVPFRGSFWLLSGASLLYLLTTLGLGLFISTVSRTQQQAMLATFYFSSRSLC